MISKENKTGGITIFDYKLWDNAGVIKRAWYGTKTETYMTDWNRKEN